MIDGARWTAHSRGSGHARPLVVAALIAALAVVGAPPAAADPGHTAHAGQPVVVTQSVGPYVLRARITPPGTGNGTVTVDLDAPERPVSAVEVEVSARRSDTGNTTAAGRAAMTVADPGPYSFRIPVEGTGTWELRLDATGPAGGGTATVPFTVLATPDQPLDIALRIALGVGAAAVALLVVLVVTARSGRSRRRALAAVSGTALVALVVAATLGVQVVVVPAAQRLPPAPAGARPPVQLLLTATPRAGTPALDFDLLDGYTGRPVDDLVPHHEALVHLVVVHDELGFAAHLHPARTGPGRFTVDLPPLTRGRHTVLAEVTRLGSGGQLLRAPFTVDGPAPVPLASPALAGRHDLGDGLAVAATTELAPAGRASTLRFRVSRDEIPIDGLDPWLGMPGHLLARSPGADGVFAHVHAAGPMASPYPPRASSVGPAIPRPGARPTRSAGPDLAFTYTFPRPGRYQVWLQFVVDRTVRTVPGVVDVTSEEERP